MEEEDIRQALEFAAGNLDNRIVPLEAAAETSIRVRFVVDDHIKSRHTANAILKQAGLPKKF